MKIVFEGYLKAMYPEGLVVGGDTVMEALQGVSRMPGIREAKHPVVVEGFSTLEELSSICRLPEVRVIPVLMGAGGAAGKQILIGAFLIGLSLLFPAGAGVLAQFGHGLFYAGLSLAIGGAIKLLMPAPDAPSASSSATGSLFFSSTKNTVRIGTPIPLVFGRTKIYGQYLSFNVNAKDYTPA